MSFIPLLLKHMATENKINKAAHFYFAKGWNVIPLDFKPAIVKDNKIEKQITWPAFNYGDFHSKPITSEMIDRWWGEHNAIAILTGKISGITVMDIDTKDLPEVKNLPETFIVETNKGYHYFFKHTDVVITNANTFKSKTTDYKFNIDIRNNGGIVFAAPSEYKLPDGTQVQYKIIKNVPLADFPVEWLKNIYSEYEVPKNNKKTPLNSWKDKVSSPVEVGSRNMDFASIIGGLLYRFPEDDWEHLVWPLVKDKNLAQSTPLTEDELLNTFNSICKKEIQKRHSGGEIREINTTNSDDEIRIEVKLEKSIVNFKIKNIISNLLEAKAITWIQKSSGLSHELPFYLKIKSDTNKEQWGRILSKAYDKKEDKETYPWTIIIAKVVNIVENVVKEHKQSFLFSEITAKQATWLIEPFIQEDQINTFFGMGSSGKTMMSLYFSTILASVEKSVMFIDYENDSSNWKDKVQKINPLADDYLTYYDSEQIPLAEQVDKIKEVIKQRDIKLVIIDSASLATGESTSDEKSVIRLMSALKLLKTTVLLIAHQRKNDGEKTPIGSIQFENQARNVWNFKNEVDSMDTKVLHIACSHTKANNTYLRRDPVCFKITFSDSDINITPESANAYFEEKLPINKRIVNLLIERPSLSYLEISNELNLSEKSVSKYLSQGKNNNQFINNSGKWSLS